MLRRDRNELLFVLEQNWALVGWELLQAETPSAIRAAFRRIRGFNCRNLEVFRLAYRRETTFPKLQAVRKRLQKELGRLREAQRNWGKHRDSAELVKSALAMVHGAQKRKALRPICEKAEMTLAQAYTKLSQLQGLLTRLQKEIRSREASFAQSELLDFIRSDRYSSTPVHFANAMAGLPYIHWRQSMARCVRIKGTASEGLTYLQFLFVAKALKRPPACPEEAVDRMKTHLYQAKGKNVIVLNALAENWYFLWRAIEQVFQASRQPQEELPYRIFAEYQRRIASQAPLDRLLAEKEIITTPAYAKER